MASAAPRDRRHADPGGYRDRAGRCRRPPPEPRPGRPPASAAPAPPSPPFRSPPSSPPPPLEPPRTAPRIPAPPDPFCLSALSFSHPASLQLKTFQNPTPIPQPLRLSPALARLRSRPHPLTSCVGVVGCVQRAQTRIARRSGCERRIWAFVRSPGRNSVCSRRGAGKARWRHTGPDPRPAQAAPGATAARRHGSLSNHLVSPISPQSAPRSSSPCPGGNFAISPGLRTRWRWVW